MPVVSRLDTFTTPCQLYDVGPEGLRIWTEKSPSMVAPKLLILLNSNLVKLVEAVLKQNGQTVAETLMPVSKGQGAGTLTPRFQRHCMGVLLQVLRPVHLTHGCGALGTHQAV